MEDLVAPSYVLIDPRPIAAEAPYAFFLPSETEVMAITPGDFAKLTFEHAHGGRDWAAQRMWVAANRTNAF